jgi:hypothetical protein
MLAFILARRSFEGGDMLTTAKTMSEFLKLPRKINKRKSGIP